MASSSAVPTVVATTAPGEPQAAGPALSAAAPASAEAPAAPASAEPPAFAAPAREPGACAGLPDARPASLVIQFRRTVLPHGGEARREGLELRADSACPAGAAPGSTELLPCRRIPKTELDRVHRELLGLGLPSLRSDPSRPTGSPHIGSRQLSLQWPGGSCAIVDGVGRRIHADDERAFFAAIDVVLQAAPR